MLLPLYQNMNERYAQSPLTANQIREGPSVKAWATSPIASTPALSIIPNMGTRMIRFDRLRAGQKVRVGEKIGEFTGP